MPPGAGVSRCLHRTGLWIDADDDRLGDGAGQFLDLMPPSFQFFDRGGADSFVNPQAAQFRRRLVEGAHAVVRAESTVRDRFGRIESEHGQVQLV